MGDVVITPLHSNELPYVLDLLARSGLPEAGLAEHAATIVVAQVDGCTVGSAGLELYEGAATSLFQDMTLHLESTSRKEEP